MKIQLEKSRKAQEKLSNIMRYYKVLQDIARYYWDGSKYYCRNAMFKRNKIRKNKK